MRESWRRPFPALRQVTGNIAMPGFTAPKLLWVRRHEPEIFARVAHVLLPKAWVRFRLTGERIEDMSDASGTLWLDVGARDWSDAALEATGLTRAAMPRLAEGNAPAGTLLPELAARWGIRGRVVVAGSAGDNAGGRGRPRGDRAGQRLRLPRHVGRAMGDTDGSSRFRRRRCMRSATLCPPPGTRWALRCPPRPPSPGGRRSPEARKLDCSRRWACRDPDRHGAVPALSLRRAHAAQRRRHPGRVRRPVARHRRAAMTQAVLEGVAFRSRDCLDALGRLRHRISEADVIGGGSRGRAWVGIIASVLGIPLHLLAEGEYGGAFGAARLARLAATEKPAASLHETVALATIEPDPALADPYTGRLDSLPRSLPRSREGAPVGGIHP